MLFPVSCVKDADDLFISFHMDSSFPWTVVILNYLCHQSSEQLMIFALKDIFGLSEAHPAKTINL